MKSRSTSTKLGQTSKPSTVKQRTGTDRLYRRDGTRKVSFYYQHADGRTETLATAPAGNKAAIIMAARVAQRRALDIIEGKVVVGSVGQMIERFRDEAAPTHYADQTKDGVRIRNDNINRLIKFFGAMEPAALKAIHGYQYLDARAKAGAPSRANKDMMLMSTICKYGVRWGLMEANPFYRLMQNQTETDVRVVLRSQVVRFYLWALRQSPMHRTVGCAAMFTYLTGFRAAEVRPFHVDGLGKDGVRVIAAKRKKGERAVVKMRKWSVRLRAVVERAKQAQQAPSDYLFANSTGHAYTSNGWSSVWGDVMFDYVASLDPEAAEALAEKKAWEALYRKAKRTKAVPPPFKSYPLTEHPAYFSLLDVRPVGISEKFSRGEADTYDFAGNADPKTTRKHYDRRKERQAKATE